jgi:hypothetical protein
MTRDSYASKTGNPAYLPGRVPHEKAYAIFKTIHPEAVTGLRGREKPLAWRILWRTIKYHESGICDHLCKDFEALEDEVSIESALNWLHSKGYLKQIGTEKAWQYPITRYMLKWQTIKSSLNVDRPPTLKPISPEEFAKFRWHQAATEALKSKEESE